ncbi:MAG: cation:proton antiporter, partial [Chthoniobacterales bacterium]
MHLSILTKFILAFGLAVVVPMLMARLKLPAIFGFLAIGVLLGPNVTGVLDPEGSAVQMLSEVGKLLFIFFVGFGVNLEEFSKTRHRALGFGLLTFGIPLIVGAWIGRLDGSGWNTAILLGSLLASHTLLAGAIIKKSGLTQHPIVAMVVGGTVVANIASMLILAITVDVHLAGFSWMSLGGELLQLALYVPLIVFGVGSLASFALKKWGEQPEVRVTILLIVIVLCAEAAEFIRMEGVVGAFLAGVAIKRAERGDLGIKNLEITAQSIFIPAFFISAGFLINIPLLLKTLIERPLLMLGIVVAQALGKWLAAWISVKAVGGNKVETRLAWSLSLPQMAATLAAAIVAHTTLNAAGEPLLNAVYMNAIVVLVVLTCTVGPLLSERYARALSNISTDSP